MKFILAFFLALSCLSAVAQNNPAEAKAAYLLAEEDFNAGKYESAINFLNEATEKLGAANAKILYLKILALEQLAKKDYTHLQKLVEAVNAFEAAPDVDSFNEEKRLEITKLRVKLSRKLADLPTNKLEWYAIQQMRIMGWKLGMTLEDLKEVYPDFFTQRAPVSTSSQVHYDGVYKNVSSLRLIIEKGMLAGINCYFINTLDDKDFSKGKNDWEAIYVQVANYLGKALTDTVTTADPKVSGTVYERTVIWKDGPIQVGFHLSGMKQNKSQYNSYGYMSVALKNDNTLSK